MKSTAIALLLLALAGCKPAERPAAELVQDALRDGMKDPDTVIFRNVRTPLGTFVCGEYNAKNSFGGYVGYKPFFGDVDGGVATAYTAEANPYGPFFEETMAKICEVRSNMTFEESQAKLQRDLDENGKKLRELQGLDKGS